MKIAALPPCLLPSRSDLKSRAMRTFKNTALLLGLICLAVGCSREPEFTAPDLVDRNPVRPEEIIEPLPPDTNGTNQAIR
jgi:hypothetical protein